MTSLATHLVNLPPNPPVGTTVDVSTSFSDARAAKGVVKNMNEEEMITFVRPFFDELVKSIISSEDIISRLDIPTLNPNRVKEFYMQHGEKFLDLLNHHIRVGQLRILAQHALTNLQRKGFPKYPEMTGRIAIGKFGKGECSEKANTMALKCMALGIACLVISTGDAPSTSTGECRYDHDFVLLGINEDEREWMCHNKEKTIDQLFSKITHGVLADPLLNILCPLKNLSDKEHPFWRYNKTLKIVWLWEASPTFKNPLASSSLLEKEAAIVYAWMKSRENKKELIVKDPMAIIRENMQAAVVKLIRKDIFEELKKLAKGSGLEIKWHKNFTLGKFWIEGTEAEVLLVQEKLQKLGIEMKIEEMTSTHAGGKQFAGFLVNPNLSQLRRINAPATAATASSNPSEANKDKADRKTEKKGN